MKKKKKKKGSHQQNKELAAIDKTVGDLLPPPGQPHPHDDNPYIRKLLEEERAYLQPEEWGIDLRPIVEEQLGTLPPGNQLSDHEVSKFLPRLVLLLAQHHLCLNLTNHLTDRQLYQKIIEEVLPQPLGISQKPEGTLIHHECCPCDSEEYLIYYEEDSLPLPPMGDEDEEDAEEEELPAKQPLVADRDKWLEILAEAHRQLPLPQYENQ